MFLYIFFIIFKGTVKRNKNLFDNREKLHDIGPKPFDRQRALFIFAFFWSYFLDYCNEDLRKNLNIDFNAQVIFYLEKGYIIF